MNRLDGKPKKRKQFEDLSGRKFNMITIIDRNFKEKKHNSVNWNCKCDCGNLIIRSGSDLKSLGINSCGCSPRKGGHKPKHGLCKTKEYTTWKNIKIRCYNINHPQYKNYGSRGIKVCKRWMKFENFIKDMGKAPSKDLTLDRINNNKGYSKSNCRWATRTEQGNNTSKNRWITFEGKTKTLQQWAKIKNINSTVISARLKRRWPLEKAFNYKGYSKGYVDYHGKK